MQPAAPQIDDRSSAMLHARERACSTAPLQRISDRNGVPVWFRTPRGGAWRLARGVRGVGFGSCGSGRAVIGRLRCPCNQCSPQWVNWGVGRVA